MIAHDVREIYAATLNQMTFFDQAGNTTTACRTRPVILAERLAIECCEGIDNPLLQTAQIAFNYLGTLRTWLRGHGGVILDDQRWMAR